MPVVPSHGVYGTEKAAAPQGRRLVDMGFGIIYLVRVDNHDADCRHEFKTALGGQF